MTREAVAPHEPDPTEKQRVKLFDGFPGPAQAAGHTMTEGGPSSPAVSLTLRVAEARVEDVGHAIARLAPVDLQRMGARAGDVLKITGGTTGVGRAESSDDGHEGMIQIDGTCRSNCSACLLGFVCRRCGSGLRQPLLHPTGYSRT
jgi:hypothetical protein